MSWPYLFKFLQSWPTKVKKLPVEGSFDHKKSSVCKNDRKFGENSIKIKFKYLDHTHREGRTIWRKYNELAAVQIIIAKKD